MDSILNKTMTFLRNNDNLNEECVIVRYGFELLLLKMIFTTIVLLVGAYTLDYSQISCSAMLAIIINAILIIIEYIRKRLKVT